MKQGLLTLSDRKWDEGALKKVINTVCAIANNGPERSGKILIGVTDKSEDARRIGDLDSVKPKRVGKRYVVGVTREATLMGVSVERYVAKIKQALKASQLSKPVKTAVLSHIDFNAFYGFGVLVISIPPQKEPSYVGDAMYWRNGDSTEVANEPKMIADIARRF